MRKNTRESFLFEEEKTSCFVTCQKKGERKLLGEKAPSKILLSIENYGDVFKAIERT